MTYHRQVTLHCDHGGCEEALTAKVGVTVSELRAEAYRRGWSPARRARDGQRLDYCTAHATYKLRGESANPDGFTDADRAGLKWAMLGGEGQIPRGAFPRWASPECRHEPERQARDGRGSVCLDCGRLRVLA